MQYWVICIADPRLNEGANGRAVNMDSLAGPAWTRESESNFKGLPRLAWEAILSSSRAVLEN